MFSYLVVAVGSELLGLSISTSFLVVVRYSTGITHWLLNMVTGLVWVGYILKGEQTLVQKSGIFLLPLLELTKHSFRSTFVS